MFLIKKLIFWAIVGVVMLVPDMAFAGQTIVDALDLSPFVPLVLDALMMVATGTYEFFVGENGMGFIYVLIWGFLAISITLYLFKLFMPKKWIGLFGFSGGNSFADGKVSTIDIVYNVAKPCMRALIAMIFLLQIKPVFVTDWVVNPFLKVGSLYTGVLTQQMNIQGIGAVNVKCPESVVQKAWISESACETLTQPVAQLSHANNQVIKHGFKSITKGLGQLVTLFSHNRGEGFLNLISGMVLVFTFVGCNLFMAMLVIQAVFNFGMALVLYPFNVLMYVVKPNDKWLDLWPAFDGIVKALQDLIITMISCAFMLCINIAIVKALFSWNTSIFVVAAGGTAASNIPQVSNSSGGFGEHAIMCLSAILTFYIMQRLFEITNKMLKSYTGGMDGLYNNVKSDFKTTKSAISKTAQAIKKAFED